MYEVSCVGGSKVDAAAAVRNSTNGPHATMKNHFVKLLRRSKSLARPPGDRSHQNHLKPEQRQVQVARNGVVVAIVDGLPFVVGAKNKNKKPVQVNNVLLRCSLKYLYWKLRVHCKVTL